jgi:hypothetical protein
MRIALEVLKTVVECPAKAAYRMSRPRDTVSETDVYLQAVTEALGKLADIGRRRGIDLQDVRDSWVAGIRMSGMRRYVHPSSFPLLVSKGMHALWTVFTTILQEPNVLACKNISLRADSGTIEGNIMAVKQNGAEVPLLLLRNPLPVRRHPVRSDPERKFMRLRGTPFYCLSLHSGSLSSLNDSAPIKGDREALNALVAHAVSIKKGIYYPRVGLWCRTCGWRKACRKEFKEV